MTASAAGALAPLSFREVLKSDVIRRVWYAQIISLFGDFLALFGVIAAVTFRMQGSPSELVAVQIVYMLPLVVLGPLAGVLVDRWPLKSTLVASDLIRAALALLLMASSSIWHLYVVLALISCVSSFFGPAQSVTIRTHVAPNGLLPANALMQAAFLGARIVGPAAAGALVAAFGPASCYAIDALSYLASASLIGSVAIGAPPRDAATPPSDDRVAALLNDLSQGLRFILGHAALLFAIVAMAAGLFVLGCFGPLIAIHVRETLGGSERLFGIVSGTLGIGVLVGAVGLRHAVQRLSNETLVLSGLGGIGAGVFLLGAVPHASAAIGAAFSIGFAFAAIMVPAQTLIQQETPQAMLGRVTSTMTSGMLLGQVLGLILSGVFAERLGIRAVFLVCAALSGALMGGGKLLMRRRPG